MGVIIGMDPHQRSATIEVIDQSGRRVAVGAVRHGQGRYAALLAAGRRHPERGNGRKTDRVEAPARPRWPRCTRA